MRALGAERLPKVHASDDLDDDDRGDDPIDDDAEGSSHQDSLTSTLDRGGNRQLNHAIHMLALSRIRHDPQTAPYMAKQRRLGKTEREAISCLKMPPRPPAQQPSSHAERAPDHALLDRGASTDAICAISTGPDMEKIVSVDGLR